MGQKVIMQKLLRPRVWTLGGIVVLGFLARLVYIAGSRAREARATARVAREARRGLHGSAPPPPWSPPALSAKLAKCIRDEPPRWRSFLHGQLHNYAVSRG